RVGGSPQAPGGPGDGLRGVGERAPRLRAVARRVPGRRARAGDRRTRRLRRAPLRGGGRSPGSGPGPFDRARAINGPFGTVAPRSSRAKLTPEQCEFAVRPVPTGQESPD